MNLFELLEPYEGKLSRTVLRGEGGSDAADLLDQIIYAPFVTYSEIVLKPGPNNAEIDYIKMSDGGTGEVRIKNTNEFNYNHVKLVYLTSAVTSTESYIFRGITIEKLYVNSQKPLNISTGWGDGIGNVKVTYIPKGCLSAYQSASFWNGPTTYVEYDFETDEDKVRP